MGFGGADQAKKLYLSSSGQRALQTQEGLEIFERILSQEHTQHVILAGQPERLQRFLAPRQAPVVTASTPAGQGRRAVIKGLTVAQCVAWDLSELSSQLLQIPRHLLDPEANLADFGYDSISLTEFADVLSTHFAPAGLATAITPALFFACPTLGMLAHYFVEAHGEAMHTFYQYQEGVAAPGPTQEGLPALATPTLPAQAGNTAALVVANQQEPRL